MSSQSGRPFTRAVPRYWSGSLAYQIRSALGSAAALGSDSGWDQGLFTGPAVALAVGKLLGLNEDQLANALSLSLVPHVPLRVTRAGALSMWKGCATAEAVRNAVFSALLAREGMTGPAEPFEGRDGLWDEVSGPFKELRLPPEGLMAVQTMPCKPYPAESQSLAVLEVIPQIREWTKADDIESIQIEAYPHTFDEIAEPAKFDPQNRETADHSMPYLIAVALMDGEVWLSSFTQERILDPKLRPLMQKMTVRVNPDFPRDRKIITVRTKTGRELTKEVTYYRGHPMNPMPREEIIAKFNRICGTYGVTNGVRDRVRLTWSNLRAVRDIAEPIRSLARLPVKMVETAPSSA